MASVNPTIATKARSPLPQANLVFGLLLFLAVTVCWKTIAAVAAYALHNESGSHILLIPVIVAYVLFDERRKTFSVVKPSIVVGICVLLAGGICYWIATRHSWFANSSDSLSASTLALVLIVVGAFLGSYGLAAARAAAFPLCLLALLIPLPDQALNWIIHLLQQGSTDIACLLFNVVGVPVLRNGFILSVPTLTIEVAAECSGIRSSIALLITCLLAAHLYLRAPWKKAVFLSLVIPLAVIKNGIRIVTLTWLSIHVDPSFLYGRLHREGGFVFFFLALLILYPALVVLERSERRAPEMKGADTARQNRQGVTSAGVESFARDRHEIS